MGTFAIISLIFSVMGAAISAGLQQRANQQNIEAADKINQDQIDYSRESAETANQQTVENYWNLYSPQSKVQQYKDAGLSPGLMYSMGGVSGTGQAAAQGMQPNLSIPTINPLINGNAMSDISKIFANAAESEKTQAETKQTMQTIENLKQQVKESEANISKIAAETENLKVDKITKELNNDLLELTKQYEAATIQTKIDITKKSYEKLEQETNLAIESVNQAKIETEKKREMIESIINNYNAQTGLLIKQQALTTAQTLTEGYKQLQLQAEAAKDYALAAEATTMIGKIAAETEKIQDEDKIIKAKVQYTEEGHFFFMDESGYGKIIGLFGDAMYGLQKKLKGFSSWAKSHNGISSDNYMPPSGYIYEANPVTR